MCSHYPQVLCNFFSHEGMLDFVESLFFIYWDDQVVFHYAVTCVYICWIIPAFLESPQLDHGKQSFWCNLELGVQVSLHPYSSASPAISLFVLSVSGLGTRLIVFSIQVWRHSFLFSFVEQFEWLILALLWRGGRILQWIYIWSWDVFVGRFLNYYYYCFNQIADYRFFKKLFLSSWFNFDKSYASRNSSFFLFRFSNLVEYRL